MSFFTKTETTTFMLNEEGNILTIQYPDKSVHIMIKHITSVVSRHGSITIFYGNTYETLRITNNESNLEKAVGIYDQILNAIAACK